MSCPGTERLAAYLDGELTANESQAVAAHHVPAEVLS